MPLQPEAAPPSGIYSLRFYETGTGTANFDDNQWYFYKTDGVTLAFSKGIRITATGAAVFFSFDGTNVHGQVASGTTAEYLDRYEGGIYIKGVGSTFVVEAW